MTKQQKLTAADLAQRLALTRPLVVLDLESTVMEDGALPDARSDRIVQVAVQKVYPDGKVSAFSAYVNPGIQIARSSSETHGISDDDVKGAPPWHVIGRPVAAGIDDADILGFNARRYDVRLIVTECKRHSIPLWTRQPPKLVDPYLLWARLEPRNLDAYFARWTGQSRGPGHRADQDVADLMQGFLAMLDQVGDDLPGDVAGMADLCWKPNPVNIDPDGKLQWRGDVPTVCFGKKYPGWDMRQVPPGFWKWVLEANDFSDEVRQLAMEAMRGVFPNRSQPGLGFDAFESDLD